MLTMTEKGLYCRAGDFYIDPCRRVDRALITHAHSDHARRGSVQYYCASPSVSLLRVRLGKNIAVQGIPFGRTWTLGRVQISFHPAGHILGSAQVRLELDKEVWVVSGDYKREADPTCEPFETVPCDVFVTEATFGTPGFSWPKERDLGREIFEWWQTNASEGFNSVLFAYSLGKTQRVLGLLYPLAERPIYCHPGAKSIVECYRAQGVHLAATICLSEIHSTQPLKGELLIVPQSFLKSDQREILGPQYRTAFASGWMAHGSRGYDRGFLLSDHADWGDLVKTIRETGARRVYVQHRGQGALVRHLRGLGLAAFSDAELFSKTPDQLELF